MAKTRSAAMSSSPQRAALGAIDAGELLEMLELHYTDTGGPDGSPFRRLYRESKTAFLKADGQEAVHFAALLTDVDAHAGVEAAIRSAGFIVGFETCRRLLLGEICISALKGGA